MNWNLKEFFNNENEFNEFIDKIKNEAIIFNKTYKDNLEKLDNSEFINALQTLEKINENISKALTYRYLAFAKDTTKGKELTSSELICNEISQNLLFFEIEFNNLEKTKKDKFINTSPKYRYHLELLSKEKVHQLSLLEEKVLLKTSPVGSSAFARLFDETMANLDFDFEDKKIKIETLLSYLSDEDRNKRKNAALSLSKTLDANSHLLTYIYNMIKTDLNIQKELRNYKFSESSMHLYNQIEKESVDNLIKVVEKRFDLSIDYYAKKREILGFEELYDYDRYAPINSDEEITFEESKKIVLKTFNEFSPKFGEIAKKAFDENWIDVYPDKNKTSGAFSHSAVSSVHPFVMLNFTNKKRDLFILAHELGHAIHQYLAYKVGYFNSSTPLTTAETASVFCEMLVFDYIYQKSDDKISLLASKLEDIFATLYRQINFTTFERRVHSFEGELRKDELDKIWLEESAKMFGKSLKLNEYYKSWWSYIPHFIHTPFYCYSYSYAQLLVLALFGLYKSKKCKNFVEIYTEFLTLGGSKSPKEMVEMFNLDINSQEFWQIGLNEVEKLVKKFKELK
ncbi:M3 family oligoendopeptidase [Campylobacter ureolyticus]|uniref:M3 family oligoendopeptidase n=1 Tax=Campylobacter ureolyticus TaxID=827 RepID=UPI0022B4D478|nr:M3 family oligoendopeptidase [Campylobacter ureolyticus]MCZ6111790.1 M3 family oligoendopeptidase [Campylobacter ureolyticus]MCZ6169386.1 M3 family oligoendopeptidase [Campylobacter ureolyticus]MDK8322812.1 M3 family oligoendopeptidase [Campylobacter ureolyticus]